jgi:hypothetical protein
VRLHPEFFQHSLSADISKAGFIGLAFRRFESWFSSSVHLCFVYMWFIQFTTLMPPKKSPLARPVLLPQLGSQVGGGSAFVWLHEAP